VIRPRTGHDVPQLTAGGEALELVLQQGAGARREGGRVAPDMRLMSTLGSSQSG